MSKFVELTYDDWVNKFQPIFSKDDDINFDTHGEEGEFVKSKIEDNLVWTWGDGDMCSYISNGYHYINRLAYHICTVPYEDDTDYQIIISTEIECDCYSEDDDVIDSRGGEYGDPDCTKCDGYGLVTNYAN